jgi:hypothetical protein
VTQGEMSEHQTLPVLGMLSPDPYADLLNTGFYRFESKSGLCGLARKIDDGIEILVVDAHPPGKGQFRQFITDCKREYASILIIEILNPWLSGVLARYGFTQWSGLKEMEYLEGMLWRRTP